MKTLWIISELFPPDETSTSYILGEVANSFAKEYEVHVICGPEVYDKRKKLDTDHPFNLDNSIKMHRVNGAGLDKNRSLGKAVSFLMMSMRLYRKSKGQVKEGDKVLLVTNPAPLVLLISRLRLKRRFELNVLVHDVFPENTIPAGMKLPAWFYWLLKSRFDKAYSRVDKFIVLGRDMADIVRKKAGARTKIEIVENWAENDSIKPMPLPEGNFKIEYAGNIGRVQGLDKLVNELPEGVELHFYGTGSMEKALKEMNHQSVFFHGAYFRSQQTNVLGACHAAIVTLQEGMYGLGVPSKSYNIMAAGRPIIYFGPENGEIALMIKEQGIGFIGWPKKWDIEELVTMGKKARVLAETKYSKQTILNKFIKAMKDMKTEETKMMDMRHNPQGLGIPSGGGIYYSPEVLAS